jgi:hypothetical protein
VRAIVGPRIDNQRSNLEVECELIYLYLLDLRKARASGFLRVLDLLKVAKHGKGREYLPGAVSLCAYRNLQRKYATNMQP